LSEKRTLIKKEVHAIRTIADGVFVISFVRDFKFRAGQVIAIDIIPDGKPRLYSIASGEKEDYVDILFDEKKNGQLTPFLSKQQPGDAIYVSEPFGTFVSSSEKAYWIAAGTGVAPFVSMARSGLAGNKILVHGARFDENFYFSNLLVKILPDRYFRCCSQQEETLHFNGRLTEWIKNEQNLPVNYQYYLCGSPEMVVQVRDLLIAKDIPFKNIISETYF